jgi:hypothetical protein
MLDELATDPPRGLDPQGREESIGRLIAAGCLYRDQRRTRTLIKTAIDPRPESSGAQEQEALF